MILNPFATMAEQFDGTGLVFNPETNAAMSLNKTGVFLWKELEKGADEPALVRALLDHFFGRDRGTGDPGRESVRGGSPSPVAAVGSVRPR